MFGSGMGAGGWGLGKEQENGKQESEHGCKAPYCDYSKDSHVHCTNCGGVVRNEDKNWRCPLCGESLFDGSKYNSDGTVHRAIDDVSSFG